MCIKFKLCVHRAVVQITLMRIFPTAVYTNVAISSCNQKSKQFQNILLISQVIISAALLLKILKDL